MHIQFAEPTNEAINQLVRLCQPNPGAQPQVLLTRPFDELTEEVVEDNTLNEPVEAEPIVLDIPGITAHPFSSTVRLVQNFIIAVDSGIVGLGQTPGGGVAFAIRGAATCYADGSMFVLRYNTGALLITPQNKAKIFRYIGERLGEPNLYVQREAGTGRLIPREIISTVNQTQDRCRNFFERMIQEDAIGLLTANNGGILLIDGALTVSYDTPRVFLMQMIQMARNNGVDLCAISKRSNIAIGGLPIDALFDAYPTFVGYAPLLTPLRAEARAYTQGTRRSPSDITMGTEVFAIRFGFGPPGLTFRVDTSKSFGQSDTEIVNDVYNKCQIYGGYPKPLIDAHHYSTFLGADALTLLSDLAVRANIRIKEQPSMAVLFEPFGAFGK